MSNDWTESIVGDDTHSWRITRRRIGYEATLTLYVGSGSSLPPTKMPFTKHMFGVSMGYTCRAWSKRRLEKRMAKAEREAQL